MVYSRFSWIPNLVGHVFFRNARKPNEGDLWDSRLINFQYKSGDNYVRDILSSSSYLIADYALENQDNVNRYYVVLSAKSTNKQKLDGKISFYPFGSCKGIIPKIKDIDKNYIEILDKFSQCENDIEKNIIIENKNRANDVVPEYAKNINEKIHSLKEKIQNSFEFADATIEFKLQNNGIVKFSFSDNDNTITDNIIKKNFINLAYHYLKSIMHSHRHHNPMSDSVLQTFLVDNENNLDYRLILQGLKRGIVNLRESKNYPNKSYDIIGFSAYIKAFSVIIEEHTLTQNTNGDDSGHTITYKDSAKLAPIYAQASQESAQAEASALPESYGYKITSILTPIIVAIFSFEKLQGGYFIFGIVILIVYSLVSLLIKKDLTKFLLQSLFNRLSQYRIATPNKKDSSWSYRYNRRKLILFHSIYKIKDKWFSSSAYEKSLIKFRYFSYLGILAILIYSSITSF